MRGVFRDAFGALFVVLLLYHCTGGCAPKHRAPPIKKTPVLPLGLRPPTAAHLALSAPLPKCPVHVAPPCCFYGRSPMFWGGVSRPLVQ